MKLLLRADAEMMENGRGQIGRGEGCRRGQTSRAVGAADHLSRWSATAGEEAGEHIAPVMVGADAAPNRVIVPGQGARLPAEGTAVIVQGGSSG